MRMSEVMNRWVPFPTAAFTLSLQRCDSLETTKKREGEQERVAAAARCFKRRNVVVVICLNMFSRPGNHAFNCTAFNSTPQLLWTDC